MKDLGTPVAGGDVQAEAVNDAGDVIASAIVGRARGSFFSSHGVATMIESFGGVPTTVQALNNRGQVVGGSQGADGNYHAFQWHKGKMTDLGTLSGGSFSFAAAENHSGTVAGSGDTEGGHMHGFVWSHGAGASTWERQVTTRSPMRSTNAATSPVRAATTRPSGCAMGSETTRA